MRLSVLDQSPIISGHDARRAIEETLALARRADELGYQRYWLAEHHAIAALGDPCPEVLVARLGAETKRIRVGTGGVLLPYYSAFRVAEAFRMLEALYPGRIDLGIGRAPGGDARTAQAVAGGGFPDASHFPQQVHELACLLDGRLPDDHPFKSVRVQPEVKTAPEIWLLGSSDYSGALAAQLGLPFSFAHFINPRGGDEVTRAYKQHFRAGREKAPRAMVCTFLICAQTDEEAERLYRENRHRPWGLVTLWGRTLTVQDLEEGAEDDLKRHLATIVRRADDALGDPGAAGGRNHRPHSGRARLETANRMAVRFRSGD